MPNFINNPKRLCLLAGLLFTLLVISKFDTFQVGAYQDDGHYVVLTRALTQFKQFIYINRPPTAVQKPDFPIGFPLLLAPFQLLAGKALWPLKLAGLLSTLINGLLLFRLWPRWTRSTPLWGAVIAAAYWFSPYVTEHARMVMSEASFLTWYLLLLALLNKDKQQQGRWWYLLAVPLLCVLLLITRTIGVAILAGVGLYYLFGRRIRQLNFIQKVGLLSGSFFVLVALLLNGGLVPQRYFESRYVEYATSVVSGVFSAETDIVDSAESPIPPPTSETLNQIISKYAKNRWRNIYQGLPLTVMPFLYHTTGMIPASSVQLIVQGVLGVAVFGLIIVGSVQWVRRVGWDSVWVTGILYVGVLAIWHWNEARLLYAIFPHLFFAFLLGCETVFFGRINSPRFSAEKLRPIAVTLFLCSLLIVSIKRKSTINHVGDLRDRTAWLNNNVAADAIVMSEYPETDYLYSTVYMLDWPESDSAENIATYIDQHAIDYLLLAPEINWDDEGFIPSQSWFLTTKRDALSELVTQEKIEQIHYDAEKQIEVYRVSR